MKQTLILLLTGVFLVCSIAAAQSASNQDETQTGPETIAALVNEEVITQAQLTAAAGLNKIFQVVFTQLPQNFGKILLSTPEGAAFLDRYQREVLEQMINSRLLVQQAITQEIKVDEAKVEEQVEGQLDQIMEQNQLTLEQVDDILKQQGSSLDEYKEKLGKSFREQLLVQGLYEEITQNATVSDEEVAAYYKEHESEFASEEGSIPPLADVQDQIRETILPKAQAQLWEAWFAKMKEEANIEIFL